MKHYICFFWFFLVWSWPSTAMLDVVGVFCKFADELTRPATFRQDYAKNIDYGQQPQQFEAESFKPKKQVWKCLFTGCGHLSQYRRDLTQHIIVKHNVPAAIVQLSKHWNISNLRVETSIGNNKHIIGLQNNKEVALKMGPRFASLLAEATALKHFGGMGAIPFLGYAQLGNNKRPYGYLLTPYIKPNVNDQASIPEVISIIKALHQKKVSKELLAPYLAGCFLNLENEDVCGFNSSCIANARELLNQLIETTSRLVMLHGNLQFNNIIRDGNQWIAVDPVGVIGDPEFEAHCFIIDALHRNTNGQCLKNLLKVFHEELGFDIRRMMAWSYVALISCACVEKSLYPVPIECLRIASIIEQFEESDN